MWPPPNIQALPSKDDVRQIREEISSIELKIEALQKSVTERKAWIAPIRKLPHEVLSQIFVDVSTVDWKAPLILQSVSRRWRDVVVGTPRAWTFMPLFESDSACYSELVSLFIERSRNATLHVYVWNRRSLAQIMILEDRIECMVLCMTFYSMKYFVPSEYDFTRMERLQLVAGDWEPDPGRMFKVSEWDMMHFPNLKFLELRVWDLLLLAITASPRFPLIRQLKVVCGDPSPLTDILMKCAKSLESIDLDYCVLLSKPPGTTPTIHLPRLRYIKLSDTTGIPGPHWYIDGSTPNLEAFVAEGDWQTIDYFKLDTSNVTHLHVLKAPDLSRFPRIVTLFISGRDYLHANLMDSINYLRKHPQYSTDLAVIEHIHCMTDWKL